MKEPIEETLKLFNTLSLIIGSILILGGGITSYYVLRMISEVIIAILFSPG